MASSLVARDPRALARFWGAVLGWEVVEDDGDYVSLAAPGTTEPSLDLCRSDSPEAGPNRLHLDLRADGSSTQEELERLLALGAVPADVGQPADVSWTVLADPEGDEFCLLSRSVQDVAAEERAEQA